MRAHRIALLLLASCSSDKQPMCMQGSCADAAGANGDSGLTAPAYAILAQPKLAADPLVKNRVIVVGTQVDGSPATDSIVLNIDRPGAGTYQRPALTLGALGASTYFSACALSTPGCAGPVTLTAALSSAPSTPIAQLPVEIVDPVEVNPAKACLSGSKVLHLEGNDQIFNGNTTYTNATWTFEAAYDEYLIIRVTPASSTESWRLTFDTRVYSPIMIPETYAEASKSSPIQSLLEVDHPALDVSGFGHECTALVGSYTIVDYRLSGGVHATIAFEQHCEGSTTTVLTGCLHHEP